MICLQFVIMNILVGSGREKYSISFLIQNNIIYNSLIDIFRNRITIIIIFLDDGITDEILYIYISLA